jgi:hypothetical protein
MKKPLSKIDPCLKMTYLGYVICATMRIRSFSVFVDFCSRNSKLNILKYSVLNDYDVFW